MELVQHGPQISTHMGTTAPVVIWAMDISLDPGWVYRLRHGLWQQPWPGPCGCIHHLSWHGPHDTEALRHKHGHRWWSRPLEPALPLMISGNKGIYTDLSVGVPQTRPTAYSLGPGNTMSPVAALSIHINMTRECIVTILSANIFAAIDLFLGLFPFALCFQGLMFTWHSSSLPQARMSLSFPGFS